MARRPGTATEAAAIVRWLPHLARYIERMIGTREAVRRLRTLADMLEKYPAIGAPK